MMQIFIFVNLFYPHNLREHIIFAYSTTFKTDPGRIPTRILKINNLNSAK